jgi:hypothetical protein
MIYSLKKIPQELRRFAVLGVVTGMLTTAVIYSRDEHLPSEGVGNGSKQAFQKPKDRQQAEGLPRHRALRTAQAIRASR